MLLDSSLMLFTRSRVYKLAGVAAQPCAFRWLAPGPRTICCAWSGKNIARRKQKRPFEMTFCCAEKAFKLLAQFALSCPERYARSEIDCHCFTAKVSLSTAKLSLFLPPKRPVENRDFVDFCAKRFALFFEIARYKVNL